MGNTLSRRSLANRFHRKQRRLTELWLSNNDGEPPTKDIPPPPKILSVGMLVLPVASLIFPVLLQAAKSAPPNSSEQLAIVTALFVSNRAYLYLMAATIVGLAATRGSNDSPRLGRRIVDLTEELLYRPVLEQSKDNAAREREKPSIIQSLTDSGFEESLDEVSTETQAILLPLLVSFILALSVFLLPFWSESPSVSDVATNSQLQDLISKVFPAINQVWNVGLLALFSRSEIRRLALEMKWSSTAIVEWGTAATITGLACWIKLWPAQNFVNMALAILVARAIQFDQFAAVVAASILLTLYDATSVFFIPAAGASELLAPTIDYLSSSSMEMAASQAAGSAMGSVAIQKLTSGSFQPGLLITKIGNSLGGSLGLGDAVFPSLLAGFVKRFDDSQAADQDDRLSLFAVSMGGYLFGCLACEFAPLISTSGLPALLFIVPIMLIAILGATTVSGETEQLFSFDPKEKESTKL